MRFSSLRLAFRIAARDARRTKGRSILVVILLGLPVFVVTVGASLIASLDPTPAEAAARAMGTADASVSWDYDVGIVQDPIDTAMAWPKEDIDADPVEHTEAEILARLPEGSSLTELTTGSTRVSAPAGLDRLGLLGIDLSNPVTDGILTMLRGEAPGDGEVVLSQAAAEHLHLNIGEPVRLNDLDAEFTISGIVESPNDLGRRFAAAAPEVIGGNHDTWLADTPDPIAWDQVLEYNRSGMAVYSQSVAADPPPTPEDVAYRTSPNTEELGMIGFLIGMIALEIVLLAGPAFVISAKRRSREFALLGAHGASPAQVRRIVLASGVFLGSVSALASLGLGAATAFAATPLAESLAGERIAQFRILPEITIPAAALAVVTGLCAALIPAYTTARQPIAAALSGRRGTTRSRKRWVILGLAMVVAGAGCAAFGVQDSTVAIMLAGLGIAELGLVLCTPALIGLISRLGRFLPLSPRIALRDAGRNRSSAAPAISAIMAVVAGGIAMTMFAVGDTDRSTQTGTSEPIGSISADIAMYHEDSNDVGNPQDNRALVAESAETVVSAMERTLPTTKTYLLNRLECPPLPEDSGWCEVHIVPPKVTSCPFDPHIPLSKADQAAAVANPHCKKSDSIPAGSFSNGSFVLDAETLAVITGADDDDVAAAAKVLDAGGVVVNNADLIDGDTATVEVRGYDDSDADYQVKDSATIPAYTLTSGSLSPEQVLYGEKAAAAMGLVKSESVFVFASTSREPTPREQDAFSQALISADLIGEDQSDEPSAEGEISVYWEVIEQPSPPIDQTLPMYGLALGSGLLVLAATAVATALAAAESRRDLSTLAAIGASPSMRRKLSLFQAGVISLAGAVLGVIAGVGASYAAMISLNSQLALRYPRSNLYSLAPPWLNIIVALAVVPLVAMLGAGLLTRSRLPSERRSG